MADLTIQRAAAHQPRAIIELNTENNGSPNDVFVVAAPPPARARPAPPPPPPRKMVPPPRSEDGFDHFANPQKAPSLAPTESEGGDEYETEQPQGQGQGQGGGGPSGTYQYEYEAQEPEEQTEPAPLPPYATLSDERAAIMSQLTRLQRQGYHVSKTFDAYSDIIEMRTELARCQHELSIDGAIKFQRKLLVAATSGLEFMSGRFHDYLDVELEGWSESVMESVNAGDYDAVFQKLHAKYKGRFGGMISPEIEIMFMIGGSAATYHLGRSMAKRSIAARQTQMRAPSQMGQHVAPRAPPPPPPQPSQPAQPGPAPSGRRDMRGPGFDLGMLGMPGMLGAMPMVPGLKPTPIMSQRETPIEIQVPPAPESERFSDRLSDVGSDLEDVPDDFGSLTHDDIKDVVLEPAKKKAKKTVFVV